MRKHIIYLIVLINCATFTACVKDINTDDYDSSTSGDGMAQINISMPKASHINPSNIRTNSGIPTNTRDIEDINVMVFDINGAYVSSSYHSQYETNGSNLPLKPGGELIIKFTNFNPNNQIAIVANYGEQLHTQSLKKLKTLKIGTSTGVPDKYILFSMAYLSKKSGNCLYYAASLKPLFAMITVGIDGSGLSNGISITPRILRIKNAPDGAYLGNKSKTTSKFQTANKNINTIPNAHTINLADYGSLQAVTNEFPIALNRNPTELFFPLHLYENMQGKRSPTCPHETSNKPCGSGCSKSWYKTPPHANKKGVAGSDKWLNTDKFTSYLEVECDYINYNTNQSGITTYRFYLGGNLTNNFDVERNHKYFIQLNINKTGGANDALWQLDTLLEESLILKIKKVDGHGGGVIIDQSSKKLYARMLTGDLQIISGYGKDKYDTQLQWRTLPSFGNNNWVMLTPESRDKSIYLYVEPWLPIKYKVGGTLFNPIYEWGYNNEPNPRRVTIELSDKTNFSNKTQIVFDQYQLIKINETMFMERFEDELYGIKWADNIPDFNPIRWTGAYVDNKIEYPTSPENSMSNTQYLAKMANPTLKYSSSDGFSIKEDFNKTAATACAFRSFMVGSSSIPSNPSNSIVSIMRLPSIEELEAIESAMNNPNHAINSDQYIAPKKGIPYWSSSFDEQITNQPKIFRFNSPTKQNNSASPNNECRIRAIFIADDVINW